MILKQANFLRALDKYEKTEFVDYAPRVFTLIRNFN